MDEEGRPLSNTAIVWKVLFLPAGYIPAWSAGSSHVDSILRTTSLYIKA